MEVSGQLCTQAATPPGKQPQVPTGQLTMLNIMGNKNWSVRIKELKQSCKYIEHSPFTAVYLHHMMEPSFNVPWHNFQCSISVIQSQWSQCQIPPFETFLSLVFECTISKTVILFPVPSCGTHEEHPKTCEVCHPLANMYGSHGCQSGVQLW
jgi:hypothetical protein